MARVRRATLEDVDSLVAMRCDFTFEDKAGKGDVRLEYEDECRAFLRNAIGSRRWDIWVAEVDGWIVSHVYVALVDKVPRPVRSIGESAT